RSCRRQPHVAAGRERAIGFLDVLENDLPARRIGGELVYGQQQAIAILKSAAEMRGANQQAGGEIERILYFARDQPHRLAALLDREMIELDARELQRLVGLHGFGTPAAVALAEVAGAQRRMMRDHGEAGLFKQPGIAVARDAVKLRAVPVVRLVELLAEEPVLYRGQLGQIFTYHGISLPLHRSI